ncbi:MAG: hypothetical protein ACI4O4_03575 [Candidatus Ventricola sp.]
MKKHSIGPRHCISLSSEDRHTFIYTNYFLPLLSHRKSPTPPKMGGFYSGKKKKAKDVFFVFALSQGIYL